ncbi:hypothetical protein EGW08_017010 [Elysia chlorotica]|uniref:Fucolectin tachylectin-4 pentraxin-1 domain-containing protein n=1 Tax=Elysia chlorotica TaxID=188477 RepID=A0A3S1AY37_ELYCH|nr:hypothetical protein EGW08_017010 [Elysia chlorotica]
MMSSGFACLFLAVVFTTLVSWHVSSAQCQRAGWFGTGCRYQCHCADDNQCDGTTGACPAGCDPEWFGPACQYVSSQFTPRGTYSDLAWLTDGDPDTCNDGNLHTITVDLDTPQPLTWLRLVVNDSDLLNDFQDAEHQYIGILGCTGAKTARVDKLTIDVACDTEHVVDHVTLTGSRLETLCSLYISGGRNVALKQDAKQPSTLNVWTAEKAVDGITNLPDPSLTCAHTLEQPSWWALQFYTPVHAMQFKVFNRLDCCKERLIGFRLDAFHKKSDTINVFSHIDSTGVPMDNYTITPSSVIKKSVERVYIAKDRNSKFLNICEVMVFGDSACPRSRFGRECTDQCNCADQQDACFVHTGGCPTGCAPGFMGQNCSIACPRGMYGSGCIKACSDHCDGSTSDCDARDGACLTGCEPGYIPPMCHLKCNVSTFGQRCEKICSRNCLHTECDHLTGKCIKCPPGFAGDFCDEAVVTTRSNQEVSSDEVISNSAVIVIVVVFVAVCAATTVVCVCLIVRNYGASRQREPPSSYDLPMAPVPNGTLCGSLPQSPALVKDDYMVPSMMQPLPENIYEMP